MQDSIPNRFPATVADELYFSQHAGVRGAPHFWLNLDGRVDVQRLSVATRRLVDTYPVLGCRFVDHWWRPYWQRHEDLDQISLTELRLTRDLQRDLTTLLNKDSDPRFDAQFQVIVLRQQNDCLCFRINHMCFDQTGFFQAIERLAHIYNRLALDPKYRSKLNLADRSLLDIGRSLGFRGKTRILQNAREAILRLRKSGKWNIPEPVDGPEVGYFISHRLSSDQARAVFRIARSARVTVHVVLLAAFALAVDDVLGNDGKSPLPVAFSVDLRTLVKANPESMANKLGVTLMFVSDPATVGFSGLLAQLRQQYKELRNSYLGVVSPALIFETYPVVRSVYRLIPYAVKRRLFSRSNPREVLGNIIGIATSTNRDATHLAFGDAKPSSIGVGSGLRLNHTAIGASGVVAGHLITLNCAYLENRVPRSLAQHILDVMLSQIEEYDADVAIQS